jgi:hypothetical protein
VLRVLALALLLANGVLLAAQWGLFDTLTGGTSASARATQQREPERLQRQVAPEAVRILSPQAASAALAAAASAAQAADAASSAAAARCLEAGPFSGTELATAERSLRDAGLVAGAAAGNWVARKTDDSGAFMVYMGRYVDPDLLQRKHDELKRMKLDVEDLRGMPDLQPGLSLGRYDSKAAADAALARMVQRGVRTARVVALQPVPQLSLLRVPVADAATRARLAGLRLPSGPGFGVCAGAETAALALPPPLPGASGSAGTPGNAVRPTPVAALAASPVRVATPSAAQAAVAASSER